MENLEVSNINTKNTLNKIQKELKIDGCNVKIIFPEKTEKNIYKKCKLIFMTSYFENKNIAK